MTDNRHDCLVNVHFGETEQQPTWMPVRDDYLSILIDVAPVDLSELPDEMDEQGVQRDPDGQPAAVGHRAQVRGVATRPVQACDGRHNLLAQPVRANSAWSTIFRWRMPSGRAGDGQTSSDAAVHPPTPNAPRWAAASVNTAARTTDR
jgi:hypothetical protein